MSATPLAVIHEALQAAGAEVMRRYASFEKIEDAPADISTDADRASQEVILQIISRAFPEDALCGEEATPTLEQATRLGSRLWIVDPIDGTRGFARKNGEFSIMIGFAVDGIVQAGGVLEPAIKRKTYAERGAGCYVQVGDAAPVRCQVSETADRPTRISMSRSQKGEAADQLVAAFAAQAAVQTYSAGIKLAQVARGETDLYLGDYLTLKDWDVCAGHILVEEAGGQVSNIDGLPIRYFGTGKSLAGRGIIATNGKLHAHALATLASGKITWPTK